MHAGGRVADMPLHGARLLYLSATKHLVRVNKKPQISCHSLVLYIG